MLTPSPPDQQVYGSAAGSMFSVQIAEDESTFSVVDNARSSVKNRGFGGGVLFRGRGQRGSMGPRGAGVGGRGGYQRAGGGRAQDRYYESRGARGGGAGRGRRFGWKDYDKPQRNRDSSIAVRPDWTMREEVDFSRLAKLSLEMPEGEDIDDYGFLHQYDRSYDKPATAALRSAERKLQTLERAAYNVTTSADPVIQELAERDEATVFATADILSMLMCAPRSVYSWDIVIVQQGRKIFIDKRENSSVDLVTVNENAADAPLEVSDAGGAKHESINSPNALALEATFINHNFALQVVQENEATKVDFSHPNPFYNSAEESEPPASKGYKYRRFDLSLGGDETPLPMIVRTEIDAIAKHNITGDDSQITIKALNEFDSKAQGAGGALDWRTKLGPQRGAVVATEMKNNSCKLARWATQAALARADAIKLGFVSRANPRSNSAHVVLAVLGYKPRELATQMNLQLANGWGIVRSVVDLVRGLSETDRRRAREAAGKEDPAADPEPEEEEIVRKYVLVKDPNKPVLRLYLVPANTFEEDEEDEEGANGGQEGEDKEDEDEE